MIAESELNRAHLLGDLTTLPAGLEDLRRGRSGGGSLEHHGWRTILKGAHIVSMLGRAFRSRGHDHQGKQPSSRF